MNAQRFRITTAPVEDKLSARENNAVLARVVFGHPVSEGVLSHYDYEGDIDAIIAEVPRLAAYMLVGSTRTPFPLYDTQRMILALQSVLRAASSDRR